MAEFVSNVLPEMADNLDKWHEFSAPLEGRVYSMYCDIKGLVTCAVGILIDPISLAMKLPWRLHDTGTSPAPDSAPLASHDQVVSGWNDLKSNREALKKLHWKYAAKRNRLRLSSADVDALVKKKLFEFEAFMKGRYFPDWLDFPADAQLAICSMAWACGAGFPATFTNFTRFANKQDWVNAALCAKIREAGNPGIVPRNKHNQTCFRNASIVIANDMDRDELHWPGEAAATIARPEPMADVAVLPRPIQPVILPPELIPLEVPWSTLRDERDDSMSAD